MNQTGILSTRWKIQTFGVKPSLLLPCLINQNFNFMSQHEGVPCLPVIL